MRTFLKCLTVLLITLTSIATSHASVRIPDPLPGAKAYSNDLQKKLQKALANKGRSYVPRTKHFAKDGRPKYVNRLILETSPYLLQHAHNPVNWYPWGEEAFEVAQKRNVPVLLSVGYSTCHWCHVMEKESFEDEEIAAVINKNYVAIKVDREERPDIDSIYMQAVQILLKGGGGWPMTVWLMPDKKPFYGGTYFPPRDGDRGVPVGFLTLLKIIGDTYKKEPNKLVTQSDQLYAVIKKIETAAQASQKIPGEDSFKKAFAFYEEAYDQKNGGVSGAPKFPNLLPIRFLLRYAERFSNDKALKMASHTLKQMANGGLYDQVGGGFHRYAVDEKWLVPHFEKMLYDNGHLPLFYLETYLKTRDPFFLNVVRDVLSYLVRDMQHKNGGFYSATDADSKNDEGKTVEGYFFTWDKKQLQALLSQEQMKIIGQLYGVDDPPNFQGRYILYVKKSQKHLARILKVPESQLSEKISVIRKILRQARLKKSPPIRDEKILTSWNALVISAFAQAALWLGDQRYEKIAVKAGEFIFANLVKDNVVYRSFNEGKHKIPGFLDDYAYLLTACLDLFQLTSEKIWLQRALFLDGEIAKKFEDKKQGGFFFTVSGGEKLIMREKPSYDGDLPSGNSIMALNLLKLYDFTSNEQYYKRAEKVFKMFYEIVSKSPATMKDLFLALDYNQNKSKEVIIVTAKGKKAEAQPLLDEMRQLYVPNMVLLIVEEGKLFENLKSVVPLLQGKKAMSARATAYVCERGVCKFPTSDKTKFAKQLKQ